MSKQTKTRHFESITVDCPLGGYLFRPIAGAEKYFDPITFLDIVFESVRPTGNTSNPAGNEQFTFLGVKIESKHKTTKKQIRQAIINGFVMLYISDDPAERLEQYQKDEQTFMSNLPSFKITFDDGDTITTSMAKGIDLAKAREYYFNNQFVAADEVTMRTATSVEQITE